MKNNSVIPTEEEEQIAFVQWCRLHGIVTEHASNEIGGSISAMKAKAMKNKRMGTTAGFPDLLLFIPILGATGELDAYQPLAIEMKRQKGSRVSPEQKEWLKILEMAGIPSAVCKGAKDAVKLVEAMLEEIGGEV